MSLWPGNMSVVCNGAHKQRRGLSVHADDCERVLATPYVDGKKAIDYARLRGWRCTSYVDVSPQCIPIADAFAAASLPERWRMMGYPPGMSPSGPIQTEEQ